jgi:glutathione S-transferase
MNTLFIGPKNYSSWSLRPWLVLKWGGIVFEGKLISLDQLGYGEQAIAEVKAVSPNGQVPVLHSDGLVIWDTLAIAEWAAERSPSLWPAHASARAQARSVTAEMHAGFGGLRRDLSMNIKRRCPNQDWPADTRRDLSRLFELWIECRSHHAQDGPWLFGGRTIADAFFTPMAARLRTYSITIDSICQDYVDTALGDPAFLEWEEDCTTDVWDQAGYSVIDGLYR